MVVEYGGGFKGDLRFHFVESIFREKNFFTFWHLNCFGKWVNWKFIIKFKKIIFRSVIFFHETNGIQVNNLDFVSSSLTFGAAQGTLSSSRVFNRLSAAMKWALSKIKRGSRLTSWTLLCSAAFAAFISRNIFWCLDHFRKWVNGKYFPN